MSTRFRLSAPRHSYFDEPITVELERSGVPVSGPFSLREKPSGRLIPAQLKWVTDETVAICFIVDRLARGESVEFELVENECTVEGVEVIPSGEQAVAFHIRGSLFTAYHWDSESARPFLYPVIGPGGGCVTRHFPMVKDIPGETTDHKHHRSIWVAHGDVNGVDNWTEEPGHGTIKHKLFLEQTSGPVFARVVALNDWLDNSDRKVMEEEREITVYNICDSACVLDMRVAFKATEGDVRFGDTKEGGICSVRVATTMDGNKGGVITNSYGAITEAETWGKRAHWCDYSGPVGDRVVGIAIFDHPSNFRYPTYWHVRDYGLMTANPFALSAYKNDRSLDGSHLVRQGSMFAFAYRIYIHDGDVSAGRVSEKYHGYINPPLIESGK